ncbi:hypothetical protein HN51_012402 [Arachis hypogaea]
MVKLLLPCQNCSYWFSMAQSMLPKRFYHHAWTFSLRLQVLSLCCAGSKAINDPKGHESHGVHLCHKCGWPFSNPHPSAKHRRAHKMICGTIEGYKLCSSEEQSCSNGSDDGHGSDNDKKSPGPEVLNIGNKEKGDSGIGDKINRSEDEVFSDAVADFPDSQGVKESLQEGSLDLSTSMEWDGKDDPKFLGSSKDSDFNGIWRLWCEERPLELIDESLTDSVTAAESEVLRCIHIGLLCVQERPENRPDMSAIVLMLNGEKPLPRPRDMLFIHISLAFHQGIVQ